MERIVAMQYRDAMYSDKVRLSPDDFLFPVLTTLGTVTRKDEHIVVGYVYGERGIKRGLLLPKSVAITQDRSGTPLQKRLQKGTQVAVVWHDIVHFDNGKFPKTLPYMYTEGAVERLTRDGIFLSKPETIKRVGRMVSNHPRVKPKHYGIPFGLIQEIVVYEAS